VLRKIGGHTSPPFLLKSEIRLQISSSGCQIVAMMQGAEPRHRYNAAARRREFIRVTTHGRFLRQRKMCPVLVVVGNVFVHQAPLMSFVEDDHMIEQIPAVTAVDRYDGIILPRAGGTSCIPPRAPT
jgi:hypothetical protein